MNEIPVTVTSDVDEDIPRKITLDETLQFSIASERALDTMCLCGIKGRLSHGELSSEREYTAANGDYIRLHRPREQGKYVDITQSDLDILRVINIKYVNNYLQSHSYKYDKSRPTDLLDGNSPACSITKPTDSELLQLIKDGIDDTVEISPEEIRQRLGISKNSLPSSAIKRSLNRLANMLVEGIYRVRVDDKVELIEVKGSLFSLTTSVGTRSSEKYYIIFASQWGLLYLHNLRAGNISWISEPDYTQLSNGAKNILSTVLAFSKNKFYRKLNGMLEISNIGLGKNRKRAIKTLEEYLGELETAKFLSWWIDDKGTYWIEHHLEPTRYNPHVKRVKVSIAEMSDTDKAIVELVNHYNMLVRRRKHLTRFEILSVTNPKADKDWRHFENVYNICVKKKWNSKFYLEAQFIRSQKWENGNVEFPLPSMMLSEEAQEWFVKYLAEQKRSPIMGATKPTRTLNAEEEIACGIETAVKSLAERLQWKRTRCQGEEDPRWIVTADIRESWSGISPFYLWAFDWAAEYVGAYISHKLYHKKAEAALGYFKSINDDSAAQTLIHQCKKRFEEMYKIPMVMSEEEFIAKLGSE